MPRGMINEIVALRTRHVAPVWGWGGFNRTIKDTMHFEIVCTPADLNTGITTARPLTRTEKLYWFLWAGRQASQRPPLPPPRLHRRLRPPGPTRPRPPTDRALRARHPRQGQGPPSLPWAQAHRRPGRVPHLAVDHLRRVHPRPPVNLTARIPGILADAASIALALGAIGAFLGLLSRARPVRYARGANSSPNRSAAASTTVSRRSSPRWSNPVSPSWDRMAAPQCTTGSSLASSPWKPDSARPSPTSTAAPGPSPTPPNQLASTMAEPDRCPPVVNVPPCHSERLPSQNRAAGAARRSSYSGSLP